MGVSILRVLAPLRLIILKLIITNHNLLKIFFALKQQKRGKLLTSHRSTTYPCYLPILGEFSGSWSYKTYPAAKIINVTQTPTFFEFFLPLPQI